MDCVVALFFILISLVASALWLLVNWLWLKPQYLERSLREQGLTGTPYKLLFGDTKESSKMMEDAHSKSITLSTNHDIAQRVIPMSNQLVINHGKNSFFWMGPVPRIHLVSPQQLKEALNKLDDFQKPANPFIKWVSQGVSNLEGAKWTKHRKIINPAFHLEKLKAMLPAFHEGVKEIMEEWECLVSKEGWSELDVYPFLQRLTSDGISRAAFGSSYQEGRKVFELLKEQSLNYKIIAERVYIPGWRYVPTKLNKRMKTIDAEIKELLKGVICRREMVGGGDGKGDLLSFLLESNLKETQHGGHRGQNVGMSIQEVIEECKTFYIAGQETTSSLLVWTLILLSQHENWQIRAREEVLEVFGSNPPAFSYEGLSHLKVVSMIFHEVLRLYPAIVGILRATTKKTKVGEISLPAGVEVYFPTLLIHRDKELWGLNANEFRPERFSEGVSKAANSFAYFPFGTGPRTCIGQNFAMLEAKVALSMILQQYTFHLSPSYAHAPRAVISLQPQFGAHLILHKRR